MTEPNAHVTAPNTHEPNEFLREQQKEAADEALNAALGVGEPIPAPGDLDEEALFQAHMARFPGQHE